MNKILTLQNISKKTRVITKELIPLIEQLPCPDLQTNFFLNELLKLIDGIIFTDNISLNELTQNLYEFLDILYRIVLSFCRDI